MYLNTNDTLQFGPSGHRPRARALVSIESSNSLPGGYVRINVRQTFPSLPPKLDCLLTTSQGAFQMLDPPTLANWAKKCGSKPGDGSLSVYKTCVSIFHGFAHSSLSDTSPLSNRATHRRTSHAFRRIRLTWANVHQYPICARRDCAAGEGAGIGRLWSDLIFGAKDPLWWLDFRNRRIRVHFHHI